MITLTATLLGNYTPEEREWLAAEIKRRLAEAVEARVKKLAEEELDRLLYGDPGAPRPRGFFG